MAALLFLTLGLGAGVAFGSDATLAPTLGDALQCRAREHLVNWFKNGEKVLGEPHEKDGVTIQFTDERVSCGGNEVPVMFSTWSMKGVKPVHIFNAIADVKHQGSNDLKKVDILYDGKAPLPDKSSWDPQVRGVMLDYSTGVMGMSDRQIFEWESYATRGKGSEYWFAATTEGTSVLREIKRRKGNDGGGLLSFFKKPVVADSCMSANHIIQRGDEVHVEFSNIVNGHPPVVDQATVSEMTWGKTVQFIEGIKIRAKELAEADQATLWTPPHRLLLQASDSSVPANCGQSWDEAIAQLAEFTPPEADPKEQEVGLNDAAPSLAAAVAARWPRSTPALQLVLAISLLTAAALAVSSRRLRRVGAAQADEAALLATGGTCAAADKDSVEP